MMTHCPLTGVNIPRFLLSVLLGFAFLFSFDFMIHGTLLQETYAHTPELWRAPGDMLFPFMMGMQFLTVLIIGFIFTRHYEGKGLPEGLRFGAAIGVLMGVLMASSYAWMPISCFLAGAWFGGGLGTGLGLGVIFSIFYKK